VVWLAERRGTLATTRVALKLPVLGDPDLAEIKREACVWVEASGHPNVLPVIEAEVYDGQVVIASEFAPDGSLADWLKRHGGRAPSAHAAVRMISGVLEGLAHLHARRIIHRDLKPANILIQGEMPRIADFGLARVLRSDASTQNVAGTPVYMAPEAWNGQRTEQTDLWSAGVILYELLAGYRPFPDHDLTALRRAIQGASPLALPEGIPAGIASVVERALRKDPNRRYESAARMLEELQTRAGQAPPPGSEVSPTTLAPQATLPPPSRQNPGWGFVDSFQLDASHSLELFQGSLAHVPADAFVSSDDNFLSGLSGVALALARVAGPEVQHERQQLVAQRRPVLGEVLRTSGGGLPCRLLYHAVTVEYGPGWDAPYRLSAFAPQAMAHGGHGETHAGDLPIGRPPPPLFIDGGGLRKLIANLFRKATADNIRWLAMPAFGTGAAGLDLASAAEIMLEELLIRIVESPVQRVTLALLGQYAWRLFYDRLALSQGEAGPQPKRSHAE